MTRCQEQTCTQHLNNIQGSIYHKLWGGDVGDGDGNGADVGDGEDDNEDDPPHARQLVAMMAVIYQHW
jgi:hypothetical protein